MWPQNKTQNQIKISTNYWIHWSFPIHYYNLLHSDFCFVFHQLTLALFYSFVLVVSSVSVADDESFVPKDLN